jgi:peptidoglycan/xylan/chitin deacetylase (PgdA/CDA1 family)
MKRREFLRWVAGLSSLAAVSHAWGKAIVPTIAFSFDDPSADGAAGLTWHELNEHILAALARHKIQSVLFVCGKRVDDNSGRQLVATWDRAGHLIANHSYSHFYFNESVNTDSDEFKKVALSEFEADALKNERIIRDRRHFVRLFRYPFFKEGDTIEKRDGMRSFLQEHGYRIGRATIDASDWAISARLERRAEHSAKGDFTAYRNFFLDHIWERAQFYDSLSQRVLGRPVRHTLLLHHNLLNALYLNDLIEMFLAKGWNPVDAEWAYRDPVYDRQPQILPAGEGLIWALAKESGKFEKELRYPAEDDVYENPKMDALKL